MCVSVCVSGGGNNNACHDDDHKKEHRSRTFLPSLNILRANAATSGTAHMSCEAFDFEMRGTDDKAQKLCNPRSACGARLRSCCSTYLFKIMKSPCLSGFDCRAVEFQMRMRLVGGGGAVDECPKLELNGTRIRMYD